VEDIFGDDDSVAVRFDAEGMHTGDFFGMAATGQQTTFFVILLLRFRNGRVIERWSQMSIVD
jgi:predicted ester cyclase